jgi:hypothetical protein
MQRSGQVPDTRISQKVEQRVARAGLGSQTRVTVQVHNGDVTLSGTLQYDTQRAPALRAARGAQETPVGEPQATAAQPDGAPKWPEYALPVTTFFGTVKAGRSPTW